MTAESYVEFVGLTAEAVHLIETHRTSPAETKSQILMRVLAPSVKAKEPEPDGEVMDFGEGIKLRVGEKLYLFLPQGAVSVPGPALETTLRKDGIHINGKPVPQHGGRPFHSAMKMVQEKVGHRNPQGKLVSLSAMRQWFVERNGKMKSLEELKDPELARTRPGSMAHLAKSLDLDIDL